jgi:DNA-binding CsgD family transcriptional regulator
MRAAEAAAQLATELGDDALLCEAIHAGLYVTVTPEEVDRQLATVRRGIAVAVQRGDEYDELRLRCKAILRLLVRCDPEDLQVQLRRHDELTLRFRLPYYLRVQAGNEVAVALAEGRFDDAEAAVDRLQRWVEANGQPETGYGVQMFSIRREQGRLAELRPVLELGARLQRHERSWMPGLAVVYAEVGMHAEAAALLDELAADGLASLPRDTLLPGVLSYLADAAFATRHRGAAEAIAPLLAPYSGLFVYVPGLVSYGAADRYLGKVHDVAGRIGDARRHYEAALALDERSGWSCWVAHSRLSLGALLGRSRHRAERARGAELVRAAREQGASMGMAALVGRGDALLSELPAPRAPRRLSELTRREREVLELVAEGLSNREIGERLHASQHTVANHVRAILSKTGAANRTEAAAWAVRQAGAAPAASSAG